MYNVVLVSDQYDGQGETLLEQLTQAGLTCQLLPDLSPLDDPLHTALPQAVLLDLESLGRIQVEDLLEQCRHLKLPTLAVVPRRSLPNYDPSRSADDFIACPVESRELMARLRQTIYRVGGPSGQDVLKVGDLVIDLERYDVMVGGRRVSLTYKEFQLLVLLSSNPGRVYTRDALLSQVWGYDYLGGTRTVDVHIRRLRSKIEDADHSFVETIWNVGYRFKSPESDPS